MILEGPGKFQPPASRQPHGATSSRAVSMAVDDQLPGSCRCQARRKQSLVGSGQESMSLSPPGFLHSPVPREVRPPLGEGRAHREQHPAGQWGGGTLVSRTSGNSAGSSGVGHTRLCHLDNGPRGRHRAQVRELKVRKPGHRGRLRQQQCPGLSF